MPQLQNVHLSYLRRYALFVAVDIVQISRKEHPVTVLLNEDRERIFVLSHFIVGRSFLPVENRDLVIAESERHVL